MIWLLHRALAAPLALDPSTVAWLPGNWTSRSPFAYRVDHTRMHGSMLTVLRQERRTGSRKTLVFQAMQRQVGGMGPATVLEEIWCEPDGTFLQVWQGTGGDPVRLWLSESSANQLVFTAAAGVFPSRVVYRRVGSGVELERQGTYQGVPVRTSWRYESAPPRTRP